MGTVPTPATQTAATVIPAATVNSQGNLANYLAGRTESGGSRKPLCVMLQTVGQALTSGTPTALLFDSESVDYDGSHSTTANTSRFTANTAGWHHVDYLATFQNNATGMRWVQLYINGSAINGTQVAVGANGAGVTQISGSAFVPLNAGDYLEAYAFQSSGGSLNTNSGAAGGDARMCVELRSV